MDKRTLLSSTVRPWQGKSLPVKSDGETVRITIASMPLIDRAALPGLPDDLEARLFNVPDQDPRILLVHPPSELYIEVSLLDREDLGRYIEALTEARLRQAMAEPPHDARGYPITE